MSLINFPFLVNWFVYFKNIIEVFFSRDNPVIRAVFCNRCVDITCTYYNA